MTATVEEQAAGATPETPSRTPPETLDEATLARFAPEVRLDDSEDYMPSSVEWFLAGTRMCFGRANEPVLLWDHAPGAWEHVPGGLHATSAPTAAWCLPGRLDLFARGQDNGLWHQWHDGVWHGWESLGGAMGSGPAVASWGPNRLDVFARGLDNGLYHIRYDGAWSSWDRLDGPPIAFEPAVVSRARGRLDVFTVGTDGKLLHRVYDRTWDEEWAVIGEGCTSGPAVASWGPERMDVFARGADGALYHRWYQGSWQTWENLGGAITDSPDVGVWMPNRLDVFTRAVDGMLWHQWWDRGWSGWQPLGVPCSSGTAVASSPERLDVFVVDPGQVRHTRATWMAPRQTALTAYRHRGQSSDASAASSTTEECFRLVVYPYKAATYPGEWFARDGDVPCYVRAKCADPDNYIYDIKYLFFYAYNGGTVSCFDQAWETHEGDWEYAVVRIRKPPGDASGQIVGVYLSAHGRGEQRWHAVDGAAAIGLEGGTHPVIHAARHSHANYAHAGETRRVVKVFGQEVEAVDDTRHTSRSWRTWEHLVRVLADDDTRFTPLDGQNWVRFRGRWGQFLDRGGMIDSGPWTPIGPPGEPWEHEAQPFPEPSPAASPDK